MTRLTRWGVGRLVAAAAVVAGVGAACGESDAPEPDAAPGAEAEAPESFELEASPVSAPGGTTEDSVYGDPPFDPAALEAHWYRSEGHYVVVFAGVSAADTPLCPGSSSLFAGTYEHITNAPTSDESACEGFDTARPAVPPRVCDGLIVYRTDIPDDTEGALWGSLEVADGEGGIAGATTVAAADMDAAPEIDYQAPAYSIPADFLPDGSTLVTC